MALVFLFGISPTTAKAARVDVLNTSDTGFGGYAFVDSSGSIFMGADATNAEIFIGGFSNTYETGSDISTAFFSDFSALASDFEVIHQEDAYNIVGVPGAHVSSTSSLDETNVIGRKLAIWLSLSGTLNDSTTEHLIYLTDLEFVDDGGPVDLFYQARIRPPGMGPQDGNGEAVVGGFNNFDHDFMLGEGLQPAFNTVAVPEPSSFFTLAGGGAIGFLLLRRRKRARAEA